MGSEESLFTLSLVVRDKITNRTDGGGGRGILYTYRYTVITRMTPALRWAAMRAILMLH